MSKIKIIEAEIVSTETLGERKKTEWVLAFKNIGNGFAVIGRGLSKTFLDICDWCATRKFSEPPNQGGVL